MKLFMIYNKNMKNKSIKNQVVNLLKTYVACIIDQDSIPT